MGTFESELTDLLNRHSMENESNTPDYLLAEFLIGCLKNWNKVTQKREVFYGRPTDFPKTDLYRTQDE